MSPKSITFIKRHIVEDGESLPIMNVHVLFLRVSFSYFLCSRDSVTKRIINTGRLGELNRKKMDETAMEYNKAIRNVVDYYASQRSDTFAVMYQELDLDLSTFPVEGLSNVDCFHPRYISFYSINFFSLLTKKLNLYSVKSHEFIAKTLWNN